MAEHTKDQHCPTREAVDVAAAAIANQRGMRRGAPTVRNVKELLERSNPLIWAELQSDADAALYAAAVAGCEQCGGKRG